jgi:hypothetical protein
MSRRRWTNSLVLLAALGLTASAIYIWRGFVPARTGPARDLTPTIEPLANPEELVGEWGRVEFPEAVIPVNWRTFSATGEFRVCYGDEIHWETYRLVDGATLETREGHNGEVNRWTVGRAEGKLVMIHQVNGWVEKYVSLPPGTVQP